MGPALRVRALRHARRPRALTRGRPGAPGRPGTFYPPSRNVSLGAATMGACLCRLLCCRRAKPANEYKKLDARSAGPIDLEGGQMGDGEEWDDFTPQVSKKGYSA